MGRSTNPRELRSNADAASWFMREWASLSKMVVNLRQNHFADTTPTSRGIMEVTNVLKLLSDHPEGS